MDKNYRKTFLIRFLGYFLTIVGLFALLFQFGPVLEAELSYRKDQLFNVHHVLPGANQPNTNGGGPRARSFGEITANNVGDLIKPISTDYGIVIEKINANSKVIADVDPGNEAQYMQALAIGVAATNNSTPPGQSGNLYIFSHSVDAPWNVARYNAVFYLLRELDKGDRIIVFYKGVRYDYTVFDKTIVNPKDISYLINRYDKPVLTLQTCDPPGTTLNRLIVRAKLVGT